MTCKWLLPVIVALVSLWPTDVSAQRLEWFERGYGVGVLSRRSSEELQALIIRYRALQTGGAAETSPDMQWYRDFLTRVRANAMQVLVNRGEITVNSAEAQWRGPGSPWPPPEPTARSNQSREGGTTGSGTRTGTAGDRPGTTKVPVLDGTSPPRRNTLVTPRLEPPPPEAPPAGKASPSLVVPLTLVLTAAQVYECAARGTTTEAQCAMELLVATGQTLAFGTAMIVIGAGGSPILTGVALGAALIAGAQTTYGALVTGVSAYGEYQAANEAKQGERQALERLADQQRRNLRALTPDRLAALATALQQRASELTTLETRLWQVDGQIFGLQTDLNEVMARAREEYVGFQRLNAITSEAGTACRDTTRNPGRLLLEAETRLDTVENAVERVISRVAEARSLAASCANAEGARKTYDAAVTDLERANTERTKIGDAADAASAFFAQVKAGRGFVKDADRAIMNLGEHLRRAELLSKTFLEAIRTYRDVRDTAWYQANAHLASIEAIKLAFPSPLPAAVAEALAKGAAPAGDADRALYRHDDDLRPRLTWAEAEVNRIEGWIREASRQFDRLESCNGIADDMPVAMQAQFAKLAAEASAATRRAQTAIDGAKDLPGLIDACLKRSTTGADGVLTGACRGTIEATPNAGRPGTPLVLRVRIDPPHHLNVTRVELDNPGCQEERCRQTSLRSIGEYEARLQFQGSATATERTFRVKFNVFAGSTLICAGQSNELTVLAPR